MGQGNITDGDVAELVRRTADAASAYIRGDIHRYLTLIKHGETYTLMAFRLARRIRPKMPMMPMVPV